MTPKDEAENRKAILLANKEFWIAKCADLCMGYVSETSDDDTALKIRKAILRLML